MNTPLSQPLSRRQALGVLSAPFVAACFSDRAAGPGFGRPRVNLTATGTSVTLIGAGDPHLWEMTSPAGRVGTLIQSALDADPDAWAFANGDLVNNGTTEEYGFYHARWGSFKNRTLFTMGNHDKKADITGAAYYDYVGGLGGERGKGYHAKTLGAWRCYFLNSEMVREEQLSWLKNDLPNWSNYHIMAMWHTPVHATPCGDNGGKSMAWPGLLGPGGFWQVLQQHGCELVISGHVHRWERFPRMLRDGTKSADGIRQFNVGTGGVRIMQPLSSTHPTVEQRVMAHGIARFDLHPDRYGWTFTDLAGAVRDSGVEVCRKALSPPEPEEPTCEMT